MELEEETGSGNGPANNKRNSEREGKTMRNTNAFPGKRLLPTFVCGALLLTTLLRPMAWAGTADKPSSGRESHWSEEIPRMLKAGAYREGVVFAGIDLRRVDDIEDVAKEAEEIMAVDASAAEAAAGADTAGTLVSQAAQEDCISITCIQRPDRTTEQLLRELAEDESVVFAEPDYLLEAQGEIELEGIEALRTLAAERSADGSDADRRAEQDALRDASSIDDLTALQWSSSDSASLHAEGSGGGVSINVPGFGTERSNMEGEPVVVAVLDYPIDFTHPDLKEAAYTFTREQQEALGCDVHGYNATWQSEDGKLAGWPGGSHGTHCAGIIGASWDGHGISGVASNVKLISIQNSIEDDKTSLINILRGMAFVKRANELGTNIRITSNSWSLVHQNSRALDAAVRELGEEQGVISVFTAGNDGLDLSELDKIVGFLEGNPYALVVAATDMAGQLSNFSNYGEELVTLAAPGSGILSTVPLADSSYLPDADRESNKFYEGFEAEGQPKVRFFQLDKANQPLETDQSICGREGMVCSGAHSLRLALDRAQAFRDDEIQGYALCMDLGDVSETGARAGDYLGFAYGQTEEAQVSDFCWYDETKEKWVPFSDEWGYSDSQTFGTISLTIPEEADLHHLVLKFDYYTVEEGKCVYLDSVGIGTRTAPYEMRSGTSMACPAVAGGAAVLAARYPEARGDELVQMVRSSVRSMKSLDGKTQTGGILDLSVDVAPLSEEAGPSIRSAVLKDRTVTLTGSRFGSKPGSAVLEKLTAGIPEKRQEASVRSWSDTQVVLELKQDFKGIAKVSLTRGDNKKKDSFTWFVRKSENVYGEDLPWNVETGESFLFDAAGDMDAYGPMQELNGELYYLPAVTKVEVTPGHQPLMVYDRTKKTWSERTALPVWLEKPSTAVCDGTLLVKGTVMEEKDGIPYHAEEAKTAVYAYDPAADAWTACSAEGILPEDTLVAAGDKLLLVGCALPEEDSEEAEVGHVRVYDPASGAGEKLADLRHAQQNPQAVISEGVLYVYNQVFYQMESVDLNPGAGLKSREYSLPRYAGQPETVDGTDEELDFRRDGVLVPISGGVLLLGPAAADGSTDTYLLESGKTSFTACRRRISDDSLHSLAAAAAGDRIYVLGSALWEPNMRLFRSETLKNLLQKEEKQKTEVKKKANPMKAKGRTVKLKAKTLRKKTVKVKAAKACSISGAQGKLSYRKVKLSKKKYNKKILVNTSSGKITVKKGVKKGKYQLTMDIRAAGNKRFKSGTKRVKVNIVVK